jgi:hypothetical protein
MLLTSLMLDKRGPAPNLKHITQSTFGCMLLILDYRAVDMQLKTHQHLFYFFLFLSMLNVKQGEFYCSALMLLSFIGNIICYLSFVGRLRNIPELQIWYRQSRAARGVPRRPIFGPDSPGRYMSAPVGAGRHLLAPTAPTVNRRR